MPDFPVVTENVLAEYSREELITITMKLQQIGLIQDDQISQMNRLVKLQQKVIDMFISKKERDDD